MPTLDILPMKDIWAQAAAENIEHSQVYEVLSSLRHEVEDARLLMLITLSEMQAFIEAHRLFTLKRQTVAMCIDTLNKVNKVFIETL